MQVPVIERSTINSLLYYLLLHFFFFKMQFINLLTKAIIVSNFTLNCCDQSNLENIKETFILLSSCTKIRLLTSLKILSIPQKSCNLSKCIHGLYRFKSSKSRSLAVGQDHIGGRRCPILTLPKTYSQKLKCCNIWYEL